MDAVTVKTLDSVDAVAKDRSGMLTHAVRYIRPTGEQPIDHEAGLAVPHELGPSLATNRGTSIDEGHLVRLRLLCQSPWPTLLTIPREHSVEWRNRGRYGGATQWHGNHGTGGGGITRDPSG